MRGLDVTAGAADSASRAGELPDGASGEPSAHGPSLKAVGRMNVDPHTSIGITSESRRMKEPFVSKVKEVRFTGFAYRKQAGSKAWNKRRINIHKDNALSAVRTEVQTMPFPSRRQVRPIRDTDTVARGHRR